LPTDNQIKRVIRTTLECIFELFSTLAGTVGAIVGELLWYAAEDMRETDAQLLRMVGLKNVRDSVVEI
jgi:hypothetical protein